MIKVMHVIPSLGIGGTEKMILELCRGLESDSCKNAVVALKFGGQTCESLRNLGIPVTLCQSPNSFLGGFLDLPRLYFQLKKEISDCCNLRKFFFLPTAGVYCQRE
ncbi:MAG: hypothetical protein HYY63_00065 [Elusimicrobia bacterium]|nr:hypothetical protein [Elusimicrobiota bacterium]